MSSASRLPPRRISTVAQRNGGNGHPAAKGTFKVKWGLARMLKGGVIMDVVTPEHARIAQEAGAWGVMALERAPADIRKEGGVARMSDPTLIRSIMEAVTIPVMAKCRIGHFVEAQILEELGIDYIDESEVLTPADEEYHIDKHPFKVPFVCGCRDLGEALRRIAEGAALIRTKGEAGTGDIVEAVRHLRAIRGEIRKLAPLGPEELAGEAKRLAAPMELVTFVAREGRLPVPAPRGAFAAHARGLAGLGHAVREVRAPADLAGLSGLVLPGGESGVQLELLRRFALAGPLTALVARGVPVLATCAGLIL